MADLDKIKDRIRKLLNLAADDGAAEGEIDNALRAAHALMLQHQLDEDDVQAPPESLQTPEDIAANTAYGTAKSWTDTERVPQWKGTIARAICEFFGTIDYYRARPEKQIAATGIVKNDGRAVTGWVFYGPADDVQLAASIHEDLILACAALAKLKVGGSIRDGAARDYCDGFAIGLYNKMREAVKVNQPVLIDGKQCTALSIVRATDIAVAKKTFANQWLKKEKGVTLTTSQGSNRSNRDEAAYRIGQADGAKTTLNKERLKRLN